MTSSLVNRQKAVETVTLKPLRHSLQVVDSVTMTSFRQLAGSSNALLSPASAEYPRKMSDNSLNGSDVFTNCITDASSLAKSRAGSLQARRLRVASSSYDSTRNAGDTSLLAGNCFICIHLRLHSLEVEFISVVLYSIDS